MLSANMESKMMNGVLQAATLVDFFKQQCAAYAKRVAFIEQEQSLTYAELWQRSGYLAAHLQQLGVAKGDRVALMLPNVLSFPVATAAILRCGALQVNINPLYVARELLHQIEDAQAETIVTSSACLPVILEAHPPCVKRVVVVDGDAPEAALAASGWYISHPHDIGTAEPQAVESAGEDIALLQYTGGTTGKSKGAMLSHNNILANMAQFKLLSANTLGKLDIVTLTALPLYHIFAFSVNMIATLLLGGKNILIKNPRDVEHLCAQWQKYDVNFMTGVNTLYKGLGQYPPFASISFNKDLYAMGGGAAIQRVVSERWHALTGRYICEGYGLSETSPVLTCTPYEETQCYSSIGFPLPDTEIDIRNEAGESLGVGEIGELCARGGQVMRGYWRQEEASAKAFTPDGFFKTGDMAKRDADGRFYIVDRAKDMILVSGFNVYPNEIEAVMAELAGVVECACIGQADEHTGEAVALYVVTEKGLEKETLVAHARANLAAYKVPKHIYFIAEMPKSAVGKILRRELRVVQPN
jgi:long-chain acyl-CoA synthetase